MRICARRKERHTCARAQKKWDPVILMECTRAKERERESDNGALSPFFSTLFFFSPALTLASHRGVWVTSERGVATVARGQALVHFRER